MPLEKKNTVQGIKREISAIRRKVLRLYLQYLNPKVAKATGVLSDPKVFIRKLLPVGIVKWLTIAAAITGLLILLMPEQLWSWQVAIFLAVFLLGPVFYRALQRIRSTFYNLLVAYPGKHLLDQEITLEQSLTGGTLEVTLHGETWKLMGENHSAGSRVRVIAIKGDVLFVTSVE